jgi:hypothetical protein
LLRHFVKVAGLGAFAFFPLGDERDHRFEKCQAGRDIFDIAARATDPDRSKRYDRAYGRIVPWIETRQTLRDRYTQRFARLPQLDLS